MLRFAVSEPPWLRIARGYLGLRELPGAPTEPTIARWLAQLRAWWMDDATPWCGTAMAIWMQTAGIEPPSAWYRARAWADWGVPIADPAVGAVVVFERAGGGHVGMVVGEDADGRLLVLGGNQGDAVSIAPFARDRVLAYRWPAQHLALRRSEPLPVYAVRGPSSTNEA